MEREHLITNVFKNTTDESDFKIEEMRGSLDIRSSKGKLRKPNESRQSFCSRGSGGTVSTSVSLRGSFGSSIGEFQDHLEKSDFLDSSESCNLNPHSFNPRVTLKEFSRKALPKVNREEKKDESEINSNLPIPQKLFKEKYKYVGFLNSKGQRHGFGICMYKNGDKYTGFWETDKKSGWGRYEFKSNGKIFKGEFRENNIDGYVEYISKNGVTHQGKMKNLKFLNDEPLIINNPRYELSGIMTFDSTLSKLVGIAKINYKNGSVYEGEIVESIECGWGITINPDNTMLKGFKSNGVPNGYCEVYYANGDRLCGHFENGKRQGLAISFSNGNYSFGNYKDDYKDGAFISCCQGIAKFQLFLYGFPTKIVEKKEDIINYINLCYPEYRWLYRINFKLLFEIFSNKKE